MRFKTKHLSCLIVVFLVVSMTVWLFPDASKTGKNEEKQMKADETEIAEMEGRKSQIKEELEVEIKSKVKSMNKEIPAVDGVTKYWVEQQFKSKKESSDPDLAIRRVIEDLTSQVSAWADQILAQHTPTGEYKIDTIEKKWGFHHFKFYVRVIIKVSIECIKFNAESQ